MNKLSLWTGGTVVAVVAVFAAAYFLLIGPTLDSTAQTNDERTQVEAQNQVLRAQNATLKVQYEHIDELRTALAALQVQVPDSAGWDSFAEMVGDIANDNGVIVTSIGSQPAAAIAGAGGVPPDGTAVAAGGQVLPVTIAFQGPRDGVLGTLADLQKADQRLLLVQTLEVKGLVPSGAVQPPVADGDVGVVLNGYVLVQPPVVPVPNQVPPPSANDNQFVPAS
ncbi:MAG: hypothetical protein FWE61_07100 [Micrococcales bacterium]|nr:hypothetical protein [Micrococcales bacterium]